MAAQTPYATSDISVLLHGEEAGEELFDGLWRQSGKKRRLTAEQVQSLEKSFGVENKLEPERKIKLAEELGLQPRQVAIWFQNRRARYKTKQLEKDYSSLKTLYENLKSDHQTLLQDQDKLKTEVADLKQRLTIREKGKRNSWIAEAGFDSEKQSSMADSYHGYEDEEQEDELRRNWVWSCDFDEPDSSCCNVIDFHIEDGDQALGFWT